MTIAPLDNPAYEPKHPPVNGRVPAVVAKWGPRSQVRWFRRFQDEVADQPDTVWNAHYCHSEHHLGPCCWSCESEAQDGYYDIRSDGWCCCRDERG